MKIILFKIVWGHRLYNSWVDVSGRTRSEPLQVIKVKGWRTAVVESNMFPRATITFMFKFFKWWV